MKGNVSKKCLLLKMWTSVKRYRRIGRKIKVILSRASSPNFEPRSKWVNIIKIKISIYNYFILILTKANSTLKNMLMMKQTSEREEFLFPLSKKWLHLIFQVSQIIQKRGSIRKVNVDFRLTLNCSLSPCSLHSTSTVI